MVDNIADVVVVDLLVVVDLVVNLVLVDFVVVVDNLDCDGVVVFLLRVASHRSP